MKTIDKQENKSLRKIQLLLFSLGCIVVLLMMNNSYPIFNKKSGNLIRHNVLCLIITLCLVYIVAMSAYKTIKQHKNCDVLTVIHYNARNFMNVEILRFMLVMYVILEHFGLYLIGVLGSDYQQLFDRFHFEGRSQLFFVIAGFFLFYNDKQLKLPTSFFVLKRWFRLSGLVIFTTIILYVMTHFDIKKFPLENNILNCCLMNWITDSDNNLVSAAWYVNLLFLLSICFFVVFKYLNKKTSLLITFFAIVVSSNFYARGVGFGDGFIWSRMPGAIFSLCVGILMAEIYKNKKTENNEINTKKAIIITVLELISFSSLFIGLYCNGFGINLGNNILSADIAILLWLFINNKGSLSKMLNKHFAVYFGKYVYSIYITHVINMWIWEG